MAFAVGITLVWYLCASHLHISSHFKAWQFCRNCPSLIKIWIENGFVVLASWSFAKSKNSSSNFQLLYALETISWDKSSSFSSIGKGKLFAFFLTLLYFLKRFRPFTDGKFSFKHDTISSGNTAKNTKNISVDHCIWTDENTFLTEYFLFRIY